jgi:predicted nucleic acid-binding protein
MIVYLDTSALVKLYVEEEGSSEARAAVVGADAVATSRVAFAEAHAAFAAAVRLGRISAEERATIAALFRTDWYAYVVVGVTQAVVELAADLALHYDLRGFDAIHLASALLVRQRTTDPVRLLAWDRRLAHAAAACGLAV